MRLGTSFSEHRATFLGQDPRATFGRVLRLGMSVIRLSAYWSDIRTNSYDELDWQLTSAQTAGQPILLTVGMKGIQWPEYYLPPDLVPQGQADDACISLDPQLRSEVVSFVSATVARYKDNSAVLAWQVENEPFNRAGPHHWWIEPTLVRDELAALRAIDADRHVVVNTFAHFNLLQDWLARPHAHLLDLTGAVPEQEALDVLGAADILGLDVYTRIGVPVFGMEVINPASPDWATVAGSWYQKATAAGKDAWIIECQAEPWEPTKATYATPKSMQPQEIESMSAQLSQAGFQTVLLWGCEYWLWRADAGDSRWLDAVRSVQASQTV